MTQPLAAAEVPEQPPLMRTPRSVDVDITAQCNQHCYYCGFFDNAEVPYQDLPTDEWLQFFAEMGRCGVMNVGLSGGEPFIRRDLPALIQGIVANRMRFNVLSNGTLIDDDIAAFIASTGRCDFVQVSVDGSSAETHEAFRGKGTFAGALRGIRTLQRHGVPVKGRVTIHRQNVHDLAAVAHLLLDELRLPAVSTNAARYLGSCRQNAAQVLLTTAERQLAMETLLRLADKYNGRLTGMAGPLSDARQWRRMQEARAQEAAPFANGGRLTGCASPSRRIAVRSDGTMVPCTLLSHVELGRVNRDALNDVWRSSPALQRLRLRCTISLARFDFCAGCCYIPYCTGDCPGVAYSLTGEIDRPNPDACLRRFLEDGGSVC